MKRYDWKIPLDEMLKYRKEHFQVEINTDRYKSMPDEFFLSVTHNGSQYSSISLLSDEAREVIAKLQEYLETKDVAQD